MIYDGVHREPLIAIWPTAVKAGSVGDSLIWLIDIFATLVEIGGTRESGITGAEEFAGGKRQSRSAA